MWLLARNAKDVSSELELLESSKKNKIKSGSVLTNDKKYETSIWRLNSEKCLPETKQNFKEMGKFH